MIAINLSEMEMTTKNRKRFGKIVDDVLDLLDRENDSTGKAKTIDAIVKKHLSLLFRKV